jgi:hypothetical protein
MRDIANRTGFGAISAHGNAMPLLDKQHMSSLNKPLAVGATMIALPAAIAGASAIERKLRSKAHPADIPEFREEALYESSGPEHELPFNPDDYLQHNGVPFKWPGHQII